MGQDLRTRSEAEGVTAHHPATVARNVTAKDGSNSKTDEQDHRRANHKAYAIKDPPIILSERVELGHPQARDRSSQPARDQHPPRGAVPVGSAPAESRGELKGTKDAVDRDTENVQHHGQGRCEEPGVVRRDLYGIAELGKAKGPGHNRNKA